MIDSVMLNISDHSRGSVGLTYVYPVLSRRSGGISVGINLNHNNACNFRCIYCQVSGLTRGSAPAVDLKKLEDELHYFLHELLEGRFMETRVPIKSRNIADIALSGNGEPTSVSDFERVISLIKYLMNKFGLIGKIKLVLITNGSLVKRLGVQRGLIDMASIKGEVWFKLDSVTSEGLKTINNTNLKLDTIYENICLSARLCPTWLHTCLFAIDENYPSLKEQSAYLSFIKRLVKANVPIRGVTLYSLARPSMQKEAWRLSNVSREWIMGFALQVKELGVWVNVNH